MKRVLPFSAENRQAEEHRAPDKNLRGKPRVGHEVII